MSDTLARVKKVTAELLGIEESKIKPESRFVEDLGAESTQSIELVATFEEEFGVTMDENEALGVKTVADAERFIDKLRK